LSDHPPTWVKVSEQVIGPDGKERTLERYVPPDDVAQFYPPRPKKRTPETLVAIREDDNIVFVKSDDVISTLTQMKQREEGFDD
jgi:hypothetical protein